MEKYLSPIFKIFQTALTSEFNIVGMLLKKSILQFLWFAHHIQFCLVFIGSRLESRLPKPLSTSPMKISYDGHSEDPLKLLKKGISMLLFIFCDYVVKFCFRFTQVTSLAALSVYIRLGFEDPVPLIVLGGKMSDGYY